jgi:hypothetical protein
VASTTVLFPPLQDYNFHKTAHESKDVELQYDESFYESGN